MGRLSLPRGLGSLSERGAPLLGLPVYALVGGRGCLGCQGRPASYSDHLQSYLLYWSFHLLSGGWQLFLGPRQLTWSRRGLADYLDDVYFSFEGG